MNKDKQDKKYTTNNIILHIKIQKMIKTWKKMAKKSRHRLNILKEWAQTEQSYIRDLYIIIEKIQKPFKQLNLITAQQDRILFPNLDSIIKLSEEMLGSIKYFIQEWNPHTTMIGQAIINFHKYFIIYRDYCNNFMKGQQIIKQVRKKPQAQKIQAQLMMDFESYIIKPVQRPPKYQLLLRQYQKALNPKHSDYENLTIAIDKYHQVNQENNQSMELQIRNKMMIKLDQRHGGIISNTRLYLYDEIAQCINFKVKLYIFNDLVVVVRMYGEDKEELEKKIFLDEESYVQAQMDGKYFINKLFLCGRQQNIHLNFLNISTRDRVYKTFQKIIHQLYVKIEKRKSLMTNITERKRLNTKVKITQQIITQKLFSQLSMKLRITVVGVQKRPMSQISNDTVYILKIQVPYPGIAFQYSYISFEQLVALEKELRKKYKMLSLPVLDQKPETMNYYDIKKNKTKIIEYRQIFIERFVNYIIRSKELIKQLDDIAHKLKINFQLWKYATEGSQECTCSICMSSNRDSFSIIQFEGQKTVMKSFLQERLTRQSQGNFNFDASKLGESFCVFNSFLMSTQLADLQPDALDSLERRLVWLDSKMGRIDYSIMPKEQEDKSIKVDIYLMSLKEDDYISLNISKNTTIHEVLEEIAVSFKIKSLRDYGLFLDYQDIPRLLDRDQKLKEVLDDIGYEYKTKATEQQNGFWKKVTTLKKWGQEMISGKKTKVYLRKYLFVDPQLQKKACEENPQRYPLLVQEVFYRFKHQLLSLSINDSKKLCALYYLLTNLEKIGNISASNFQIQKLKVLMPEGKWQLLDNSLVFEKDIYFTVNELQKVLGKENLKTNILHQEVINLVNDVLGWNSLFFQVTNYDPPSLPGNTADVLLGINRYNLTIIRHKQIAPLLQIPLCDLIYKVTAFSIFIETQERILRFDGKMMYDIKKLIQIYKALSKKFDKK